ncbi:MAG TPA: stalk domain-containing protein [Clostridia bacterium]|nr:stalk domain-containing protein [Clostridia bacterium]
MKRKMSRKIAVFIITTLIFSLFLGAVAFANDNFKNLKAWFGELSIYRNNQRVYLAGDDKPFIVDGRTYVPLRAMSNLFNKEVGWDGVNYRIDLNDKPEDNLIYLTQQLYTAQIEVQTLQAKVKQLEEELAAKKDSKKYTLKELKSYLNKEYGTYKKVEFDIDLYENKKDIEVDIYVDLDYDYYEWNKLSDSNIKSYIQNIVDDILDDYKNVSIEGSIMDSSGRNKTLVSFYTKSSGTVVIDIGDKSGSDGYDDLDDLEDYLNNSSKYNKCYGYYGKYVYFDIELYEDKDGDIEVYITVTSPKDGLDYLKENEIKEYLGKLYDEIIDGFKYADIYGYIEDDYTDYEFDFDSNGNARLY